MQYEYKQFSGLFEQFLKKTNNQVLGQMIRDSGKTDQFDYQLVDKTLDHSGQFKLICVKCNCVFSSSIAKHYNEQEQDKCLYCDKPELRFRGLLETLFVSNSVIYKQEYKDQELKCKNDLKIDFLLYIEDKPVLAIMANATKQFQYSKIKTILNSCKLDKHNQEYLKKTTDELNKEREREQRRYAYCKERGINLIYISQTFIEETEQKHIFDMIQLYMKIRVHQILYLGNEYGINM